MPLDRTPVKNILGYFSKKRDRPSTSSSEEGTSARVTKKTNVEDTMEGVKKDHDKEFDELLEDPEMDGVVGDFERHLEDCFKDFKAQIVNKLKNVLTSMNKKIGELENRVQRIENRETDIDSMELKNIKIELNRQHQYSRKDNLRVFGQEENKDEDCKKVVCDLIQKALNVKIEPCDISAAHRLPQTKKQKHKPIIVRMKDRSLRQEIPTSRKKLKGTGKSIAEDMTASNVRLLAEAEASKCFKAVWFANGRVRAQGKKDRIHTLDLFVNFQEVAK